MKKLILNAIALCGLVAVGWYIFGPGSDLSGTYIGENDHQAFLLQIVQSGGGLTGFFEEADLTPDGQVEQDNLAMAGERDGRTFALTLTPSGLAKLFIQPVSMSGTYSGTSVSLIDQSSNFTANLNLQKGDAQTYQGYVSTLAAKAQTIQVQKAAALARQQQIDAHEAAAQQAAAAAQNLEGRIENDMKLYTAVPGIVSTRVVELAEMGGKIHSETGQMQAALAREEALGGYQSGPGGQISGAIQNANGNEVNGVNAEQSHLNDIKQNGIPALLQRFKENDALCRQIGATNSGQGSFTGAEELLRSCVTIESLTPAFQNQVDRLLAAYQNLFNIWQTENARQQQIITQSGHWHRCAVKSFWENIDDRVDVRSTFEPRISRCRHMG